MFRLTDRTEAERATIGGGLLRLLAGTLLLGFKSRRAWWLIRCAAGDNVGARVQDAYRSCEPTADQIAQAVLCTGVDLPPRLCDFATMASIAEEAPESDPTEIVAALAADHDQLAADADTLSALLPLEPDDPLLELIETLNINYKLCADRLRERPPARDGVA